MRRFSLVLSLLLAAAIASAQPAKPHPAQEVLKAAIKQAESSDKTVILIFHASWCGWCKRLDAGLEDPAVKPIIEDNYVVTHLVVMESKANKELENPGGGEILKELGGEKSGLPFYAFIDGKGKMIANSNAMPKNQNIGYPAEKEEIAAFEGLLKKTAKHLTDDQRSQVMSYFVKNAPKPRASSPVQDNKDAIINDLNNLAAFSFQYRIRPKEMGGGVGSYLGFKIAEKLKQNENATYEAEVIDKDHVRFKATSAKGFGSVTETIDESGRMGNWTYSGQFQ
ncbi:MAG: thioredoxin family protein [Ignavibacteria bacterium]|nr:thioredoxin family protein [Ignavibacteria bacterium]